jgi:MFS family permease
MSAKSITLGLRANWQQFSLLVLINAFVGAMIGLERTIVPLIAEAEFGLASRSIMLSFLVSFGIVKAASNLFAGRMSDRLGRKPILVAGWLVGLPAPFLIIFAPNWGWIVAANVLLGINQGLCWSTTVIMKITGGPKTARAGDGAERVCRLHSRLLDGIANRISGCDVRFKRNTLLSWYRNCVNRFTALRLVGARNAPICQAGS